MTAPKSPSDRQPTKAEQEKAQKRQREMLNDFMSSGLNFTPFTIDAGDGIEWKFTPDPMPEETERMVAAMRAVDETTRKQQGTKEAYAELLEAIKDRLMDPKQKKEFPHPLYGQNALVFFALHLTTGRDGFPTK